MLDRKIPQLHSSNSAHGEQAVSLMNRKRERKGERKRKRDNKEQNRKWYLRDKKSLYERDKKKKRDNETEYN